MALTIRTRYGRKVDIVNPDPDTLDIRDMAWSLSHLPRYTGHVDRHYSVAQHSVLVSTILQSRYEYKQPSLARWGLMHDTPEFVYGDVSSPVKRALRANGVSLYDVLEDNMMRAIANRYELGTDGIPPEVKTVDAMLRYDEMRNFMGRPELKVHYVDKIIPWSASEARERFLKRYKELFHGDINATASIPWGRGPSVSRVL